MLSVTLKDLRKAGACYSGYNKVVRSLQGKPFTTEDEYRDSYLIYQHDAPVSLTSILESNDLDDAVWALRCVPDVDRDARLFAVWCARQVEHLMTDQRSHDALNVAERFAKGLATVDELSNAHTYASAASAASARASAPAYDVAYAAAASASAVVSDAAPDAAAYAVAYACAHAYACARLGNYETFRDGQSAMFVRMCKGTAPWQFTVSEGGE